MPLFQRHGISSSSLRTSPLDITPAGAYTTTADIALVGVAAAAVFSQPRPSGTHGGGLLDKINIATSLLAVGGIVRVLPADSRPFGVKSILDITRRPPVPAIIVCDDTPEPEEVVGYTEHVTRRGRVYWVTEDLPWMQSRSEAPDTQREGSTGAGQPSDDPIVQGGGDGTPPRDVTANGAEVVEAPLVHLYAALFKVEVTARGSSPPSLPPSPATPELEGDNRGNTPFYFGDMLLLFLALLLIVIGGRFTRHVIRSKQRRNRNRAHRRGKRALYISPAHTSRLVYMGTSTSSSLSPSENTCPASIFEFLTFPPLESIQPFFRAPVVELYREFPSDGYPLIYLSDSALQAVETLFDKPMGHKNEAAQFSLFGYMLARSLLSSILPYFKAAVRLVEEALITAGGEVEGKAKWTEATKKIEKEENADSATDENYRTWLQEAKSSPTLALKEDELTTVTEKKQPVYHSVSIQTDEIKNPEPKSVETENSLIEVENEEVWEIEVEIEMVSEKALSVSDNCPLTQEEEQKPQSNSAAEETSSEDEWATAVPAKPPFVQDNEAGGADDTFDRDSNASFDIPVEASFCERIIDEPIPAQLDHEDAFDFWFDTIPSLRRVAQDRTPSPCAIPGPSPSSTPRGHRRRRLRRLAKAKWESRAAEGEPGETFGSDFLLAHLQSRVVPAVTPLSSTGTWAFMTLELLSIDGMEGRLERR